MTTKPINLLFLSVGRRVQLLRAFRDAYESLDLPGIIIAVDKDPLAPALQVADASYIVPQLDDANFIQSLMDICSCENVGAIFPLIDPDILVLANHRKELEGTGAKVFTVSTAVAEMSRDKWFTYQYFRQIGILTPKSWLPGEIDDQSADYPLFIKPRHGSAAKNTFKIRNKNELAFFSDYVPVPIIQECVPGPEITNDVIIDFDGNVLSVVSRQRIEVRWGEVAKGVTIFNRQIIDSCIHIANSLEAVGPITIQCMMKGDLPLFTEINARFGGGLPLGIAAGADSPRWLLSSIAGLEQAIPPIGTYLIGLHLTRFDDSFTIRERDLIPYGTQ